MTIDHHTFRLADGVTEDQFLEADRRVQQEFAPFQEGFARRTTARDGDTWLIETLWYSADHAEAALTSDHAAAVVALRACIDPPTASLRRYEDLGGQAAPAVVTFRFPRAGRRARVTVKKRTAPPAAMMARIAGRLWESVPAARKWNVAIQNSG